MIFLKRIYIRWKVRTGRAVNIWSRAPYPAGALSNLYNHSFVFEDVACGSMESFLQSLKVKSAHDQQVKCGLDGLKAKLAGSSKWKETQRVYWKGKTLGRHSVEFQLLIRRAYKALFTQNEDFRQALLATKGKQLYHVQGKTNPYDTILTAQEFCRILEELRDAAPWRHQEVLDQYKVCTRRHCPFREIC